MCADLGRRELLRGAVRSMGVSVVTRHACHMPDSSPEERHQPALMVTVAIGCWDGGKRR